MAAEHSRIVTDPKVQHGKPVIRGTRVPVSRIVGGLAGGMTFDEVEQSYGVTREDIRAASRSPANWWSGKSTTSCRHIEHLGLVQTDATRCYTFPLCPDGATRV